MSASDPRDGAASTPMPRLRVLASGSQGNCTVLATGRPGLERLTLIDAGLSPRRTRRLLADSGMRLDQIDDVVLTHLDRDHFHPGWCAAALSPRARYRIHAAHAPRARSIGVPPGAIDEITDSFDLRGLALVSHVHLAHDEAGVAAFRFDFHAPTPASLGFATDLGRVTNELIDLFRGVGLLAIESNYDTQLQLGSERPAFLKHRIMDGAGHLSNEEAFRAVRSIAPRDAVVLLHLSRQCNTPDLATSPHVGRDYKLICADQFEPTPWLTLTPDPADRAETGRPTPRTPRARASQAMLFASPSPAVSSTR